MTDYRELLDDAQVARQGQTVAPAFAKNAFHCIFCAVFVKHTWVQLSDGYTNKPIWECTCTNCHFSSFWKVSRDSDGVETGKLISPASGSAPMPHPDMPDAVRKDYLEARSIVDLSPRGASALLRVAVQNLMVALDVKERELNAAIGKLVERGLDPEVQQALDALRVVGNNAVHPGELDLQDDAETAGALFGVLNFIIEQMINRPRKLATLYDSLPQGAKDAIARRDGVPAELPSETSAT